VSALESPIRPLDVEALRAQVQRARPFPFFAIDGFLEPAFAREVAASYPSFQDAERMGLRFATVNERNKVQITDSRVFPPAVARLNEALSSPEWLALLGRVMGIDALLADPELHGGGMHETGPRGHLDVHIDFNLIESSKLHRRLNILVFLNEGWPAEWGGELELWDQDVRERQHAFLPEFNRCVVFETSERSFHGVTAVRCPPDKTRKSFAAYYYTREPPAGWDGRSHCTIFRARPGETLKGAVQMPAEELGRKLRRGLDGLKRRLKGE